MSGTGIRHLPFAPLERYVLLSRGQETAAPSWLAGHLATSARQIYRWRAFGIGLVAADHACMHMGVHPMTVWGDDWLAA